MISTIEIKGKERLDFCKQNKLPAYYIEHCLHLYLAVAENKKVIAFALTYINPYHPYCDELYITISEEKGKKEIARLLLQAVEKDRRQPLKISLLSTEQALINFLLSQQFEERRRCYEFSISRKQIAFQNIQQELVIQAFNTLSSQDYQKVLEQIYEDYDRYHLSTSPTSRTIGRQEWYQILTHNINEDLSKVYLGDNGQITYLLVETDIDEEKLAFVSRIGGNTHPPISQDFLKLSLEELWQEFDILEFEIDSTDTFAWQLMTFLKEQPEQSFNAYVKP